MTELKRLETAIETLRAGLTAADLVVGWVGGIQSPERKARYARWRAMRLELRAAKAKVQGREARAKVLLAKQKVWAEEADRLEREAL